MRLPIRARLTLVSSALMATVLLALGAFLYLRLEAELRDTVDLGLRSRAALLVDRVAEGGGVSASALVEGDEAFAQLLAPDGRVIATSAGVTDPLLPADALDAGSPRFLDRVVQTTEEPVPARLLATRIASGEIVVVGASVEEQQEALARLLGLLALALPAAVLLASGVGWLVAGAALRPVERLRREADALSSAEPGRQLAEPGTRDELDRLARSLNRMLARLGAAVEVERRFVADASHELRTPLANLRAEIDVALRRDRTADQLSAALRSVRDETDRLGRLAEDLLVIARLSSGGLPVRREPTRLDEVVDATLESFAGRASQLGVTLRRAGDAPLHASVDALRIRQALANLVDNALRHTPSGGSVDVLLGRRGNAAEITVEDTGRGFPPDFLSRIGTGFGRADASRAREDGGTGLGLTIVQAIVRAHGGRLTAANREGGGARVVVELPD